ncbi:MAG: hypothetical protein WCF84_04625 [Anaerolineae bacterium]
MATPSVTESHSKNAHFHFDSDAVAHFETVGWRANYARNWPYMLYLAIRLLQAQFRMSLLQALRAAYYVTRASVAWVPIDHDLDVVRVNLEEFYRLAHQAAGLPLDPIQAAALELKYWIVHRELSGKPDKTALVESLAELHAGIFGASVQAMRPSAENRAAAATTVDLITSHQSKDVEADYRLIEDYLRKAYRQINEAIAAQPR